MTELRGAPFVAAAQRIGERGGMAGGMGLKRAVSTLLAAVVLVAAAPQARAQGGLCDDPAGVCGAKIKPGCLGSLGAGAEAIAPGHGDPAAGCAASLGAYSSCIATAASECGEANLGDNFSLSCTIKEVVSPTAQAVADAGAPFLTSPHTSADLRKMMEEQRSAQITKHTRESRALLKRYSMTPEYTILGASTLYDWQRKTFVSASAHDNAIYAGFGGRAPGSVTINRIDGSFELMLTEGVKVAQGYGSCQKAKFRPIKVKRLF